MHVDEHLGAFWRDGLGLADAAERAGLPALVAACPGWTVTDLVWHTGEWLVAEPDPGGRLVVTHEHAEGDAAVRGAAADLLLALWRRADLDAPGTFEVFGDAGVALRLAARTDLA